MVLAYLRGLLKPNYPNGTSSLIREELLLATINNELDADLVKFQTMITLSFAQFMKSSSINQTIQEFTQGAGKVKNLILGDKDNAKPKGIDASVKLYHALDKSGLL